MNNKKIVSGLIFTTVVFAAIAPAVQAADDGVGVGSSNEHQPPFWENFTRPGDQVTPAGIAPAVQAADDGVRVGPLNMLLHPFPWVRYGRAGGQVTSRDSSAESPESGASGMTEPDAVETGYPDYEPLDEAALRKIIGSGYGKGYKNRRDAFGGFARTDDGKCFFNAAQGAPFYGSSFAESPDFQSLKDIWDEGVFPQGTTCLYSDQKDVYFQDAYFSSENYSAILLDVPVEEGNELIKFLDRTINTLEGTAQERLESLRLILEEWCPSANPFIILWPRDHEETISLLWRGFTIKSCGANSSTIVCYPLEHDASQSPYSIRTLSPKEHADLEIFVLNTAVVKSLLSGLRKTRYINEQLMLKSILKLLTAGRSTEEKARLILLKALVCRFGTRAIVMGIRMRADEASFAEPGSVTFENVPLGYSL